MLLNKMKLIDFGTVHLKLDSSKLEVPSEIS